jgi:hypothetical protein
MTKFKVGDEVLDLCSTPDGRGFRIINTITRMSPIGDEGELFHYLSPGATCLNKNGFVGRYTEELFFWRRPKSSDLWDRLDEALEKFK